MESIGVGPWIAIAVAVGAIGVLVGYWRPKQVRSVFSWAFLPPFESNVTNCVSSR